MSISKYIPYIIVWSISLFCLEKGLSQNYFLKPIFSRPEGYPSELFLLNAEGDSLLFRFNLVIKVKKHPYIWVKSYRIGNLRQYYRSIRPGLLLQRNDSHYIDYLEEMHPRNVRKHFRHSTRSEIMMYKYGYDYYEAKYMPRISFRRLFQKRNIDTTFVPSFLNFDSLKIAIKQSNREMYKRYQLMAKDKDEKLKNPNFAVYQGFNNYPLGKILKQNIFKSKYLYIKFKFRKIEYIDNEKNIVRINPKKLKNEVNQWYKEKNTYFLPNCKKRIMVLPKNWANRQQRYHPLPQRNQTADSAGAGESRSRKIIMDVYEPTHR